MLKIINIISAMKQLSAAKNWSHPYVCTVTDLAGCVMDTLDKFEAQNLLTWEDIAIQEDKIWLKVGGDHGRGSVKMSLQIANIKSQNS